MPLQQVPERVRVRHVPVEEGLDRDRVGEDSRHLQQGARALEARRLTLDVHLDATRRFEPHHPHLLGTHIQELVDLGPELLFVLPYAGVLDRDRRGAAYPAWPVGHVSHRDVGRSELAGLAAVAGVDPGGLDEWVRVQDFEPQPAGTRMISARGRALDRVSLR